MRTANIKVGHSYTNGKGTIRKVIAEGSEYVSHTGQTDCDCVRYEVIAGRHKGMQANMTRNSFAKWAKAAIKEEAHETAVDIA